MPIQDDDNAPMTKSDFRELLAVNEKWKNEIIEEVDKRVDKRIEARAPATKTDVDGLMKEIGNLYIATERWKDEIIEELDTRIDARMDTRFAASEKRMIDQFGVIAENLYYDYFGVEKDHVKDHEKRIVVLERRAGIRP